MYIEGLLGALHLGLIVAINANDDFVHLPVEDAKNLIFCLENYELLLRYSRGISIKNGGAEIFVRVNSDEKSV